MNEDESHLSGLAVGHYVVGGFMMLFACIPLVHMAVGMMAITGGEAFMAEGSQEAAPPAWFGWLFFLVGLGAFLIGQAVSVSIILSGRFIKQRKHYWFSFVLACIACAFMPVGTVLGVLTIIVLSRHSVKALYGMG